MYIYSGWYKLLLFRESTELIATSNRRSRWSRWFSGCHFGVFIFTQRTNRTIVIHSNGRRSRFLLDRSPSNTTHSTQGLGPSTISTAAACCCRWHGSFRLWRCILYNGRMSAFFFSRGCESLHVLLWGRFAGWRWWHCLGSPIGDGSTTLTVVWRRWFGRCATGGGRCDCGDCLGRCWTSSSSSSARIRCYANCWALVTCCIGRWMVCRFRRLIDTEHVFQLLIVDNLHQNLVHI